MARLEERPRQQLVGRACASRGRWRELRERDHRSTGCDDRVAQDQCRRRPEVTQVDIPYLQGFERQPRPSDQRLEQVGLNTSEVVALRSGQRPIALRVRDLAGHPEKAEVLTAAVTAAMPSAEGERSVLSDKGADVSGPEPTTCPVYRSKVGGWNPPAASITASQERFANVGPLVRIFTLRSRRRLST